jgi:hypothetical protein
MPSDLEQELAAIKKVVDALEPLDAVSRRSVIDFVFQKLGIADVASSRKLSSTVESAAGPSPITAASSPTIVRDIRTLKDEKNPMSANQMAALVAYYLSEVAPPAERKDTIGTDEVTKYFKQAGFKLPGGHPRYTLTNAKNAGYLDSTADSGRYKLNPVGYNLVVHNLPGKGVAQRRPPSKKRNPRSRG